MDWQRLLQRFDTHWRILLSHLILFGFVYPGERSLIPGWMIEKLSKRLKEDGGRDEGTGLCRGTLLSREQYLDDIERWGYNDARLRPTTGAMTPEEVTRWTAAAAGRDQQ
jgi:hypothetical protein